MSQAINKNNVDFSRFLGSNDIFYGQNLQHFLELEIAKKMSYQKGLQDHKKTIINEIRKSIEKYQSLTARIADCVREIIKKEEKPKEIGLKEARTDLSKFFTDEISILFIVDIVEKKEAWFTKTINQLAMQVFEEEKIYPELLFVNARNTKINKIAVSSAYPAVRVYKDKHV